MVLGHIGEKTLYGIIVERAVHPAVIIIGRVIDAGQREHAAKELRPSEKENGRMRRPHIHAHDNGLFPGGGVRMHDWQYLICNMAVIIFLSSTSPGIDALLAIPALLIDRVYAE